MNNSYLQRDSKQESDGDNTYQSTFNVSKTSKIEYLIENEKFDEALSLVDRMLEKGVYVTSFTYPVVPKGKARIRTQVSAGRTKEDLDFAVACFKAVKEDMGL